jgi:hypothetical protein
MTPWCHAACLHRILYDRTFFFTGLPELARFFITQHDHYTIPKVSGLQGSEAWLKPVTREMTPKLHWGGTP